MAHDDFSASDLLGSIIDDRFEILEKLGEGGMGAIYKARQISMDRVVALKILLRDQRGDPISVERFRHEAYLASRLKHPNAIVIHDFGQTGDGLLYIAMEFLAGETLKERLSRVGPLPIETAVKIMTQTLRTIAEAHRMGLVHRDLKPDNIFLTPLEGDEDFVKVLDFGIAKLTAVQDGIEGYQGGLTAQGKIYGTPNYMSPEQIRGKTVDRQSDLYSMGVIFYEVLAGYLPFIAQTPVDVMMMHLRDPPRPLLELRQDVPVELERTILRALEKDRRLRYQSGDEFLDALENFKFNSGFYALPARLAGLARPSDPGKPMVRPAVLEDDEPSESGAGQNATIVLEDGPAIRSLADASVFGAQNDEDDEEGGSVSESTVMGVLAGDLDFADPEENTVFEEDEGSAPAEDGPLDEEEEVGFVDTGVAQAVAAPARHYPPPAGERPEEPTMLEVADDDMEEVEPSRLVPIPDFDDGDAKKSEVKRTLFGMPVQKPAAPLESPRNWPAPVVAQAVAVPVVAAPVVAVPAVAQPIAIPVVAQPAIPQVAAPAIALVKPVVLPVKPVDGPIVPVLSAKPAVALVKPAVAPVPAIDAPRPPRPTMMPQRTGRPLADVPTEAAIIAPRRRGTGRWIIILAALLAIGAGAAAVIIVDPFAAKQGPEAAAAAGPAKLEVTSTPEAVELFEQGRFVGETPIEYELDEGQEKHDLKIVSKDRTFQIVVPAQKSQSWLFVRVPDEGKSELGFAVLSSEPSGAQVKLADRVIGKTPMTLIGPVGEGEKVTVTGDSKTAEQEIKYLAEGAQVKASLGGA